MAREQPTPIRRERSRTKTATLLLSDVIDEEEVPRRNQGWMKYFAQDHRPSPASSRRGSHENATPSSMTSNADPGLMADMKRWRGMTSGGRKKFLVSVIDKRMESFSDKNFSFAMPDIEIDEDRLAVNPGSASARENNNNARQQGGSRRLIISASLATIYHEGTHNVLSATGTCSGTEPHPRT